MLPASDAEPKTPEWVSAARYVVVNAVDEIWSCPSANGVLSIANQLNAMLFHGPPTGVVNDWLKKIPYQLSDSSWWVR